MKKLNEYMFNVFNLIKNIQQNGLLIEPVEYKINKEDKNVLVKIYNLHEIYKSGINQKQFNQLVVNYTINTDLNIIKSGIEVSKEIEKIIIK